MHDLTPAAEALADLVANVRDEQLADRTPCGAITVADLLDHIDGFALAFATAARKQPLPGAPHADGANLGPDWRTRIPQRLAELAQAWQDPAAWTGQTAAGGVDLPGTVAAAVAADELIVHGWDLAVASGQPFQADPALVELATGFAAATAAQHPEGTPGLFGPVVKVAQDAPPLDQLLALTGRRPAWTADLRTNRGE
jgi:uncharacterized protein (TIGR03086 family)